MRVLVLSHTRCGSTTLCKWLSKELDFVLDERPYDFKIFNSIIKSDNVIIKIVAEEYYPTKEDITKFDRVICLTRENSSDASISFIRSKNVDKWHDQYEVTDEWISENKNKISEQIYKYDEIKLRLKEYKVFQIIYENIYVSKSDINRMLNYMDINSPKHLDMLGYDKKYRKDNNVFIKKHISII